MTCLPNLSEAQRHELAALLKEQLQPGRKPSSFDQLVRDWQDLVTSVKCGYTLTVYDYLNDLAVRDQIEMLKRSASKDLSASIAAQIAKFDADFEAASEPARVSLRENAPYHEFWLQRVPLRRSGEFKDDLASFGYV